MTTGEVVVAKVSRTSSILHNIQPITKNDREQNSQRRSIFDREINVLKNVNHENIIRFIEREFVDSSDNPNALPNREVIFIEYCNGGSVGDLLRLPANRYGLNEDLIIHIMKDVFNALKYLHEKHIIHRDIKPDNIMQSTDINGKSIFKLTDLGVARQINPDELASPSIQGTPEFIHPVVYYEVFSDIQIAGNGKTHAQFPFEVEMWSFGVTIYQCSTGRLPFQPYGGVRHDPETMKTILRSIPPGCISGIQNTFEGEIQWAKTLPNWCRLSSNLKERLEKLLSRLFETNQNRLMKHQEFFDETDKILSLIPIYYLNLKKCTLTCGYFQNDDSIDKLINHIQQDNQNKTDTIYYCLFQNIHYPISKTDRISIKTFYDQFPVPPSREKPLVIYTFLPLRFDQKCLPEVSIPELQPMLTIRDVFLSVFEWSKNQVGLFFHIKNQLIEYEFTMKLSLSSFISIHRLIKTKLFHLLSSIRKTILDYQVLHEFERIIHIIETQNQPSTDMNQLQHKSIIKSLQTDETSHSSEQQNLSNIRRTLRPSINFYSNLIEYDSQLSTIIEKNFTDDHQFVSNTSYLSKQIHKYSLHIQRIDKYVKDAIDLNERFRRDTTNKTPTTLLATSNIIRQKFLKELYEKYIHFINEECYPLILEIFKEYKKTIQQQIEIHYEVQRIQLDYENQSKNSIPIHNLQQIINNELQKMDTIQISLLTDYLSSIHHKQQIITDEISTNSNKTNIHRTIQMTIEQARNNSNTLNDIIKQLKK